MSCQHGNHVSACDLCDQVYAAWERGYNAALEAAANKAIYLQGCSATYIAEEIRALKRPEPQREQSPQQENGK